MTLYVGKCDTPDAMAACCDYLNASPATGVVIKSIRWQLFSDGSRHIVLETGPGMTEFHIMDIVTGEMHEVHGCIERCNWSDVVRRLSLVPLQEAN